MWEIQAPRSNFAQFQYKFTFFIEFLQIWLNVKIFDWYHFCSFMKSNVILYSIRRKFYIRTFFYFCIFVKKNKHLDEEEAEFLYEEIFVRKSSKKRIISLLLVIFSCWAAWKREILMKIESGWIRKWKNKASQKIIMFFFFCLYRCKKWKHHDFLVCPNSFWIKNHWKITIWNFCSREKMKTS